MAYCAGSFPQGGSINYTRLRKELGRIGQRDGKSMPRAIFWHCVHCREGLCRDLARAFGDEKAADHSPVLPSLHTLYAVIAEEHPRYPCTRQASWATAFPSFPAKHSILSTPIRLESQSSS